MEPSSKVLKKKKKPKTPPALDRYIGLASKAPGFQPSLIPPAGSPSVGYTIPTICGSPMSVSSAGVLVYSIGVSMKTRIQKDSDVEIKAMDIVHTAFKSLTNEQKTRDGTEARQGSGVKC